MPDGVEGIERRAGRIGKRDFDVFVALLQGHADAGQSAAGADGADEAVELALQRLEDLRTGRFIVSAPIGDVVELVRPDGSVWR